MEGGLILEDGLHPDNPEERAWMGAMRQAAEKARRLYPEDEEEE